MGEVERLEVPNGAIHNGREHLRRLVDHYDFACEAGGLAKCADYTDAVTCFEVLVEYIRQADALFSKVNEERRQALCVKPGIREALEFYRDNWSKSGPPNEPRYGDDREPTDALWADCGQRAEAALKALGYVPVASYERDALLSQLEEMRGALGEFVEVTLDIGVAYGEDENSNAQLMAAFKRMTEAADKADALLSQTDEGERMEGDGE